MVAELRQTERMRQVARRALVERVEQRVAALGAVLPRAVVATGKREQRDGLRVGGDHEPAAGPHAVEAVGGRRRHGLARLVEAEILYTRGEPPAATYTFKHALIQDTAYQSLLKSKRQQHHLRIARMMRQHQLRRERAAEAAEDADDEAVSLSRDHRLALVQEPEAGDREAVLRPVLERTYPMTQLADAHRVLEGNATFGKIVVEW